MDKQRQKEMKKELSETAKKAQTLIRNFIMERFLERIALSQYRNNFTLKAVCWWWLSSDWVPGRRYPCDQLSGIL